MTRMHYICVVMIVVSSLLFLATYFHHIDKKPKDLSFARAVVTVTDRVIPDISNSEMSMPTLKPDLGAITEAKAVEEISVYPNPIVSTATIKNAANAIITVYDITGNEVLNTVLTTNQKSIDLNNLNTGFYYMQINKEDISKTIKIINK